MEFIIFYYDFNELPVTHITNNIYDFNYEEINNFSYWKFNSKYNTKELYNEYIKYSNCDISKYDHIIEFLLFINCDYYQCLNCNSINLDDNISIENIDLNKFNYLEKDIYLEEKYIQIFLTKCIKYLQFKNNNSKILIITKDINEIEYFDKSIIYTTYNKISTHLNNTITHIITIDKPKELNIKIPNTNIYIVDKLKHDCIELRELINNGILMDYRFKITIDPNTLIETNLDEIINNFHNYLIGNGFYTFDIILSNDLKLEQFYNSICLLDSLFSHRKYNNKYNDNQNYLNQENTIDYVSSSLNQEKQEENISSSFNKEKNIINEKQSELPPSYDETINNCSWDDMYNFINDYYLKNNKLPIQSIVVKGMQIGNWIKNQRSKYSRKTLSDDQINKLSEIGIINIELSFDKMIELITDYYNNYGKLNTITKTTVYNNINIGIWYEKLNNKILKDLCTAEELLIIEKSKIFISSESSNWENWYKLICKYKSEHEYKLPLSSTKYEDKNIGDWIYRQKVANKDNKLNNAEKIKLKVIGVKF